ncbi:MAG: GTP-binding protein, partial [Patescibacteria group bacterium]
MSKQKPAKTELIERAPIIAVMGHIDHGKSKLLDYIRHTNIVDSEAGGITQHTSAYEVVHQDAHGQAKKITFLDTPGHAAFETMRERSAVICDIAVLIVSAEEGVKAQTIEAYNAIKTAGRPFIVAINKIDKPNANVDLVVEVSSEQIADVGGRVEAALKAKGVEDPEIIAKVMTDLGLEVTLSDESHPVWKTSENSIAIAQFQEQTKFGRLITELQSGRNQLQTEPTRSLRMLNSLIDLANVSEK